MVEPQGGDGFVIPGERDWPEFTVDATKDGDVRLACTDGGCGWVKDFDSGTLWSVLLAATTRHGIAHQERDRVAGREPDAHPHTTFSRCNSTTPHGRHHWTIGRRMYLCPGVDGRQGTRTQEEQQ